MRHRRDFGLPEETVNGRKIRRLWHAMQQLRAAGDSVQGRALASLPARIDLVAVERAASGELVVRHHRSLG